MARLTLEAVNAAAKELFTCPDVRKVKRSSNCMGMPYAAFHNGEPAIFFPSLRGALKYFVDMIQSYKVGVKTPGDTTWACNQLRFATVAEAQLYGASLAFRWTAVTEWKVIPSIDPVNQPTKQAA